MTTSKKDPTAPIRRKARSYPDVEEGTSCTQSSFKCGKRAFLYIGMQGGRYKAMFKLQTSLAEAAALAANEPDCYQVGSTAWVTARFTEEDPMPTALWKSWLEESYALSVSPGSSKPSSKKTVARKQSSTSSKSPRKKK